MRMNRAVLAALLCSAVAPATCDPFERTSPFDAARWTTLSEADRAMPRTMAAPNTTTLGTMPMPDATVALEVSAIGTGAEPQLVIVPALPSTSTAPELELQSRLLIACLGLVLAVAGGAMLLLQRR